MKQTYLKCLFILFVSSCSISEKQIPGYDDIIKAEALMEQYKDSVMIKPEAMVNIYSAVREELTDSISSYLLLLHIAVGYYFWNEADTSTVLFHRILDFAERESARSNHAFRTKRLNFLTSSAFNSLGINYMYSGLLDSAIFYFERSIEHNPTVDTYINVADMYLQKGDFPAASQYYRKALFIIDSLNQGEQNYFSAFTGMAKLYQDLDNFTMADQFYQKASHYSNNVAIYEKYYFENTRGNFYYLTKDYDKALECFRTADRLADTLAQPISKAISRTNIGEVCILLEQPDSARFYLNHAKELFGPMFDTPQFNFYITGLYAALALLEDDLKEAEKFLLQPYDTLSVNPQFVYFHNRRLDDFYSRKQNYQKAYFYRKEAQAYDDSIRSVKVRNNIAEIDARYSQDTTLLRKDIHIASVENKALQWRNTAVATVALLVLIVLSVAGLILYIKKRNELRYVKQRSTITGLRMEIIRNRLSPHFMFNALNLVMPSLGKYSELETPFRLLIQLLRDNLIASEQMAVPLQQEIERVQHFLQFQALKQTEHLRTEWHVSPDVSTDMLVPAMSIQIPVENAVKYAFLPDCADAHLQVLIKPESEAIGITIEDNGVGYHPDMHADRKKGTGSGLKMLRQTIELLNTHNSDKIFFKIENKRVDATSEQGTCVYMHIPLHYNFEL